MISGTFHPTAQEWRYYSREKALIHTLHLAQLPAAQGGDTILVLPVEQVKNKGGFSTPPFPIPSGPNLGANASQVTNEAMVIDCFGAVNCAQGITAQNKMGITVGPIGGALSQINFSPEESGYFVVYAQCYSDVHSFAYQGAGGDGKVTLQIANGGNVVAQAIGQVFQDGGGWSTRDIFRRIQCDTSALVHSNGLLTAYAFNLGGDCCLSMWAMKVADDA